MITSARGSQAAEDTGLRQVVYGRRPNLYRIIYKIDHTSNLVCALHIRHGARDQDPSLRGAP
jgi:mRNA-degrading endonuclease RelE of RelBE toxin-antitoxin system